MSSVHSFVGYAFMVLMSQITSFSWAEVFMYPLVAMGSSIIVGLTWTFYLLMNKIINHGDQIIEEIER